MIRPEVPVDPVHDPGAQRPVDAREGRSAVIQQRVDQGPVRMARRRVDHQPHGLVDHDHVAVLVDHIQRDLLGEHVNRGRVGQDDGKHVAGGGLVILLYPPAAAGDRALLQQPLGGGAGQLRQGAGEELVHPLPGPVSRQMERRHPASPVSRTYRRKRSRTRTGRCPPAPHRYPPH